MLDIGSAFGSETLMSARADIDGPIARGALSDHIVDIIRRAILRGMMLPGQHLTQSGLADDYAISKVPVREALKQLHAEGLLQHDRNRGYFVAPLLRDEVMELYRIRRWIEGELLRSARWPTRDELRRLKKDFDMIARPVNAARRDDWLAALDDSRKLIFGLSPHKTLLREAMRLWTLTDRVRALLPDDASATGERAIYDALATQDREKLLAAHAADRDRIDGLLEEMFETMSAF